MAVLLGNFEKKFGEFKSSKEKERTNLIQMINDELTKSKSLGIEKKMVDLVDTYEYIQSSYGKTGLIDQFLNGLGVYLTSQESSKKIDYSLLSHKAMVVSSKADDKLMSVSLSKSGICVAVYVGMNQLTVKEYIEKDGASTYELSVILNNLKILNEKFPKFADGFFELVNNFVVYNI